MNIHHNDNNLSSNIKTNIADDVNMSELIDIVNIQTKMLNNICKLQKMVVNTDPRFASNIIIDRKIIAQEIVNDKKLLDSCLDKLIKDLSYTTIMKDLVFDKEKDNINKILKEINDFK